MPETITPPAGLELDTTPVPPPGLELDKPEGQNTGFWGRIGENVSGITHAVTHPRETAHAVATSMDTIDPEITKEAADAWRNKNYGRYAADVVEGLPLIGAPIRRMEKDIRGGDYGAVAGDVATGLAAKYIPKAIGGAPGAIASVAEHPAAGALASKVARAGVKMVPGGRTALRGWDLIKALGEEGGPAAPRKTPAPPLKWNAIAEPQAQTPAPPLSWRDKPAAPVQTPAPPIQGSNTPIIQPRATAPPPAVQGSNAPQVIPSRTAPAPPIQGSNAPQIIPGRTAPPPAIQGSNALPVEAPIAHTPAPPIQGSNAPPEVIPAPVKRGPPPIQGSNARPAPATDTVLNPVSPGETPSPAKPKASTPSTESNTVLNTGKKKKAAAALSKELGGKGNKPLVIPAEDTSAAAVPKISKDIMGALRKGGITPEAYRSASAVDKPAIQAHIRDFVKSRGLKDAVAADVIDSLEGFALGGVVESAPAQKAKVRYSKRGVPYGSPKELRKLKKSK